MGENRTITNSCLICILFGICLFFIVIISAIIIYHLHEHSYTYFSNTSSNILINENYTRSYDLLLKSNLPTFVDIKWNPCEHFYDFVCYKWTQEKLFTNMIDKKYKRIRQKLDGKLMIINETRQRTPDSGVDEQVVDNSTLSIIQDFYQICQYQPSHILLDELRAHIFSLIEQYPFQNYFTLFSNTNLTTNVTTFLYDELLFSNSILNPFFSIHVQEQSSTIIYERRPLLQYQLTFNNIKQLLKFITTTLNLISVQSLYQFETDFNHLISTEQYFSKSNEYNTYTEQSFIIKRIKTYDFSSCLVNRTYYPYMIGVSGLKYLLKRLINEQLGTNTINIIQHLDSTNDDKTFLAHIQLLLSEIDTIEHVFISMNETSSTISKCLKMTLKQLTNRSLTANEVNQIFNFTILLNQTKRYLSNDWQYFAILHKNLLINTSIDTLVNFILWRYYLRLLIPYYQPVVSIPSLNYRIHSNSCIINSCFDLLHCHYPFLLNYLLIDDENRISTIQNEEEVEHNDDNVILTPIVKDLILRYRQLIDQSDHIDVNEKLSITDELDKLIIVEGHYNKQRTKYLFKNMNSYFLQQFAIHEHNWTFIEFVQLFVNYSEQEYNIIEPQLNSYNILPTYISSKHILFLPYGFLNDLNATNIIYYQYQISLLLLQIIREKTKVKQLFRLECLIKQDDSDQVISLSNEQIVYYLIRSQVMQQYNIISDEYLYPFINASIIMQLFLIHYSYNFCSNNSTFFNKQLDGYLNDDKNLLFRCPNAIYLKRSKCFLN